MRRYDLRLDLGQRQLQVAATESSRTGDGSVTFEGRVDAAPGVEWFPVTGTVDPSGTIEIRFAIADANAALRAQAASDGGPAPQLVRGSSFAMTLTALSSSRTVGDAAWIGSAWDEATAPGTRYVL